MKAFSNMSRCLLAVTLALAEGVSEISAGPWSGPLADPTKPDAGIPGFIGPHGDGMAREFLGRDPETGEHLYTETTNPGNYVNPLFFAWASSEAGYSPASPTSIADGWKDTFYVLGPVTGDVFDVASLGDLSISQVTAGQLPGSITVRLSAAIRDLPGADFVVFENGFASLGESGVAGQLTADLAFVEVSSDGVNFARIPAQSLTPSLVSTYGTLDVSNVHNLAGKHANSYGVSWGTPFNLFDLNPNDVAPNGPVNPEAIEFIRMVDIPGTGQILDQDLRPIYDPAFSSNNSSGGFDLEAVGAISVPVTFAQWAEAHHLAPGEAGTADDPDGDGMENLMEAALGRDPNRKESQASTTHQVLKGQSSFCFNRDTRLTNLTIEVQTSTNLKEWNVLARSIAGGPLVSVAPYTPIIEDASASPIASVGVIRRQTVKNMVSSGGSQFFRLRVFLTGPL